MMGVFEKRYDKFLDERGLEGWLERNVGPLLPQGKLTLPAVKEKLCQYLSGTSENTAAMSAQYIAQALKESGVIVQTAGQLKPTYEQKLDELYAKLEEMKMKEKESGEQR